MLYGAKNGILNLSRGEVDYIRFGTGKKVLVMLPGLGDGLRTMQGTALPMALMYRALTKDYTVYAFSRLRALPQGDTTRTMAADVAEGLEALGIARADILGVSMGGMIAQYLAVDFPQKVNKLILVVTSARPNPILAETVTEWMEQAKAGDHTALMDSNLRKIYSDAYYRKNKWMIPLVGRLTKPKSYDRFLVQSEACLTHNAFGELGSIRAKTLVIGGEQDHCLGGGPSREIATEIPGAALKMYPQWGHGLYEEAKDFLDVVLDFLR